MLVMSFQFNQSHRNHRKILRTITVPLCSVSLILYGGGGGGGGGDTRQLLC